MWRTRLAQVALVVAGTALLAVGWNGFAAPETLLGAVGVALERPNGLSEARATYGGMHVGIGAFLVAGAFAPALRRAALLVALAFFGGLVAGRSISVALDGWPGQFVVRLSFLESLGALAALVAFMVAPRPR